jgi:hypothetical protein
MWIVPFQGCGQPGKVSETVNSSVASFLGAIAPCKGGMASKNFWRRMTSVARVGVNQRQAAQSGRTRRKDCPNARTKTKVEFEN